MSCKKKKIINLIKLYHKNNNREILQIKIFGNIVVKKNYMQYTKINKIQKIKKNKRIMEWTQSLIC